MGIFTPNIKDIEAKGDVKGLIKCLSNRNSSIQQEAEAALVRIGRPALEPLLITFAKVDSSYAAIKRILEKMQKTDVIEPLIEIVTNMTSYTIICFPENITRVLDKIDTEWRYNKVVQKCVAALIHLLVNRVDDDITLAVTKLMLGTIKAPYAVRPLLERLLVEQNETVRDSITFVLDSITGDSFYRKSKTELERWWQINKEKYELEGSGLEWFRISFSLM